VRQAQSQVRELDRTHVHKFVPVLRLLRKCLCVSSFHFTELGLLQSGQGCAHVQGDAPVMHLLNMCLCSIVSTWLVRNSGWPVRIPESALLELVQLSKIVNGQPKFCS